MDVYHRKMNAKLECHDQVRWRLAMKNWEEVVTAYSREVTIEMRRA